MKKIISSMLALALCLCLTTPAALAAWPVDGEASVSVSRPMSMSPGMHNFSRLRDYAPGTFSDVPAGAWYEQGVRALYEAGLLDGGRFNPQGYVTLGEAVSLAVLIHRTYHSWTMPEGMSAVQYALNTGIITAGQYEDFTAPATRRSFAAIMGNALPPEALQGMNIIMDGAIPDVPMSDPGASGIYRLYRAGVLVGGDILGTFHPEGSMTRGTGAVIAARMINRSLRQGITLMKKESHSVSLDQSSMRLAPGHTQRLIATVFPVNTNDRAVAWASSEPRTAVVDQEGNVTAIQPGTAVITATIEPGVTATCAVRVPEMEQE